MLCKKNVPMISTLALRLEKTRSMATNIVEALLVTESIKIIRLNLRR